ncbi:helix-turn-helix domain-containing protein [Bdellovibrio sp. NC01]|uniref:winged helix-turn-helix transcriptional regulator n=1 Tax=Bdellovibrio sp. NC01 TaxID=2220073 RepID=UPI00115B0651|nr:helix-turn-helix domain-containing protein [Bdellovibrio sp. NC01]QDK39335.1 transcriptional regulator [Bdellovibrio sp. NC01]
MVKAKSQKSKVIPCPVTAIVEIIGGKWKPMIVFNLLTGKKRFNELQRLSGNPSARVLTIQLRELEEDRIVKREVFDQIPPKVEYSLTARGKSLNEVLEVMAQWGKQHG